MLQFELRTSKFNVNKFTVTTYTSKSDLIDKHLTKGCGETINIPMWVCMCVRVYRNNDERKM